MYGNTYNSQFLHPFHITYKIGLEVCRSACTARRKPGYLCTSVVQSFKQYSRIYHRRRSWTLCTRTHITMFRSLFGGTASDANHPTSANNGSASNPSHSASRGERQDEEENRGGFFKLDPMEIAPGKTVRMYFKWSTLFLFGRTFRTYSCIPVFGPGVTET